MSSAGRRSRLNTAGRRALLRPLAFEDYLRGKHGLNCREQ